MTEQEKEGKKGKPKKGNYTMRDSIVFFFLRSQCDHMWRRMGRSSQTSAGIPSKQRRAN